MTPRSPGVIIPGSAACGSGGKRNRCRWCEWQRRPVAKPRWIVARGAWVPVGGKRQRPRLFRMVLSPAPIGYGEMVWQQRTESFIRLRRVESRAEPHSQLKKDKKARVASAKGQEAPP